MMREIATHTMVTSVHQMKTLITSEAVWYGPMASRIDRSTANGSQSNTYSASRGTMASTVIHTVRRTELGTSAARNT